MRKTAQTVAECTVTGRGERPAVRYVLLLEGEVGSPDVYSLICKSEDDEAVMPDIARSEEAALTMFSVFVRNTVTPTGCFDVIEELI